MRLDEPGAKGLQGDGGAESQGRRREGKGRSGVSVSLSQTEEKRNKGPRSSAFSNASIAGGPSIADMEKKEREIASTQIHSVQITQACNCLKEYSPLVKALGISPPHTNRYCEMTRIRTFPRISQVESPG